MLRGDMIETYTIVHNEYDSLVSGNLLHLNTNRDTRGHNIKLCTRHSRTNTRKLFFSNRVVEPWNSLLGNVVNSPSLVSFERRLDTLWHNEAFLYDFRESFKKNPRLPVADEELDIDLCKSLYLLIRLLCFTDHSGGGASLDTSRSHGAMRIWFVN